MTNRIRTKRQARAARDVVAMHREIARCVGAEAITPRRAKVELDRERTAYVGGFTLDTRWPGVVFAFREIRDPRRVVLDLVVLARVTNVRRIR